jgi:DNA-directed RNA polymerase subunit beta
VVPGQVLSEGYATQNGELALGRNQKLHLCHGKGIQLEDAIVISEKWFVTIFTSFTWMIIH